MGRFLNKVFGIDEHSRTSTQYSMRAGWFLLITAVGLAYWGLHKGLLSEKNMLEVIWAFFITAGAFFGVNITRITVENVKKQQQGGKDEDS